MKLLISHCCQQSFYLLWFFCRLSPALILTFNSSLKFPAFHSRHTRLLLRGLQWKMLDDSRYPCAQSWWPSLVFPCLHPSEVLIYRSNQSFLAGLQENAPKMYSKDWKWWTYTKLRSLSHKHAHHTAKIRVFMMANASQGSQQLGPVLSVRASSLGQWKRVLDKGIHQATMTFAASNPTSLHCHWDEVLKHAQLQCPSHLCSPMVSVSRGYEMSHH